MLEGQVVGGVHMGLGHTLSETFETEGGRPVTDTVKSLNIIPASGMPPVEIILVEEYQPEGPYGAKGMGEAVLVPTAAAVAGALYAFDGVRRTSCPCATRPPRWQRSPSCVASRETDMACSSPTAPSLPRLTLRRREGRCLHRWRPRGRHRGSPPSRRSPSASSRPASTPRAAWSSPATSTPTALYSRWREACPTRWSRRPVPATCKRVVAPGPRPRR